MLETSQADGPENALNETVTASEFFVSRFISIMA